MKKILSIILALILITSVFVFSISAETEGVIKAGRVSAKAGEDVTIPVSLVDHKGVCIIRVTVKYDAEVLSLTKVEQTAADDFSYTVNKNNLGEVVVLMDSKELKNYEEDITLFELKFNVKSDAAAGRSLVRVICEEGMATYLVGSGSNLSAASFIPATSTGAVTVLCAEHDFVLRENSGDYQCSKCGAVKTDTGSITVDSSQGLPEIDVSSETETSSQATNDSLTDSSDNDDGEGGKIKFVYFIPVIAALVIVAVVVVLVIRKKKNIAE